MKIVELKKAMDARFEQVDARFERVDARFQMLETRLATEHEATRRHMDMVAEQLKAEYRLGFDRMLTTDQRLASLDATNALEHTTFAAALDEHEVRIRELERPSTRHGDLPPRR